MVKKVLVLIAAVTLLRIISGCGDCPDDPVFFEFSDLSISNLDNSGAWGEGTSSDSMFDEAVSFRIMINGYFEPVKFQSSFLSSTGFSSCYAFECEQILEPIHPIVSTTITTLYPIDNSILENSDVSNLFVASESSLGNLYQPLNSYIAGLKDKLYFDFSESFNIYLKSKVLNDKARFIISIRLDNDSIISDTTNTIYIKAGK